MFKIIVTFIVLLLVVSYVVVHQRCTAKGKIIPSQAMEAYLGKGGLAPLIFKPLYYMEVSGHLHTPAILFPGKKLLEPTKWVSGWASDISEKKISRPCQDCTFCSL